MVVGKPGEQSTRRGRRSIDWTSLGLQFGGFLLVVALLGFVKWPLPPKLLLAFALATIVSLVTVSLVTHRIRRAMRRRAANPKRIRVISVETVPDLKKDSHQGHSGEPGAKHGPPRSQ